MNTEHCSYEIILHAGNANSNFVDALDNIEEHKYNDALQNMKTGDEELALASKAHMDILVELSSGKKIECDVLLAHAFDHIAMANCNKQLALRLLKLYQSLDDKS